MQWLIDLIIEAIGIPPTFIDGGDPVLPHFDKFDLTPDAAWHELDLSAIVPEGATAVALSIVIFNTGVNRILNFRRAGNTSSANISSNTIRVASATLTNDNIVKLDENRKIEYFLSAAGWVIIGITVKGWWL